MQNGCICCTLRQDLLEEVSQLAATGRFDYLIIESTGISEPMQVRASRHPLGPRAATWLPPPAGMLHQARFI
jgi:G3E family GTPase